ncbi:MAG TPA: ABC transporter permease [Gammaproteobacteria bacterium]|nr:ABC transporter permease [Gammaproteobacteria bacterium]
MKKTLQIAAREFLVTVSSRAFIIGLLMVPLLGASMALLLPRLLDPARYHVSGEVAVIDPDGRVAQALRTVLDPANLAKQRAADAAQALAQMPPEARPLAGAAMQRQAASRIDLRLVERPAGADLEKEKTWLYAKPQAVRHLALVVVHADAVERAAANGAYGSYDLYVPTNLDDRAESAIKRSLGDAIVTARVRARGLDPDAVKAMTSVPRVRAVTVSADQERRSVAGLNFVLPAVFGALLFMGVLTGGQALLTSTVEEKASRVVEVLLSAVSPMQLMAGKLLGQMAVSAVALALYVFMGLAVLMAFTLLGLIDFSLIAYLAIFFAITYLVVGSLMMAVGSAVNEMREAQTLVMPIMLLLMLPWLLWMPISRDPSSAFSVAMSFIPAVNGFAMLLRMTSVMPPPAWQVWLSIGVGIASVFAALWFAAKVFKIGLLMHGKPPDFRTLIRWARAA